MVNHLLCYSLHLNRCKYKCAVMTKFIHQMATFTDKPIIWEPTTHTHTHTHTHTIWNKSNARLCSAWFRSPPALVCPVFSDPWSTHSLCSVCGVSLTDSSSSRRPVLQSPASAWIWSRALTAAVHTFRSSSATPASGKHQNQLTASYIQNTFREQNNQWLHPLHIISVQILPVNQSAHFIHFPNKLIQVANSM